MTETNFHRKNHYVPRVYLKLWNSCPNSVLVYSTLVSHAKVPIWKKTSINGIAYQQHLYTQIIAGKESDEIEQWLNQEYENPAEEVLQKIISDARLRPSDWRCLARFLAAQDIRTPARFAENLKHQRKWMLDVMDREAKKLSHEYDSMDNETRKLESKLTESTKKKLATFPLRVKFDQKSGELKAEAVCGRGLWLHGFRNLLEKMANVLLQHRWTILCPPKDMSWFTSDNPVVKLNWFSSEKYNFRGGWGSKNTEIFFPISPRHLLYTKIGLRRPLQRGTQIQAHEAKIIRRFIAENAYRLIFAAEEDKEVQKLRPRIVSFDQFQKDKMQWKNFHEEQTKAELDLMSGS